MIIENAIKNKLAGALSKETLFLRNFLKEELQNFVLNFVYNSDYKNLIFTGGTCLRKNYGLNRLSEDLDFDYTDKFDINDFNLDITKYFKSSLGYKSFSTKISTNKNTIFLKFPILKELGLLSSTGTPEDLFLRCDFSKEVTGVYNTEINLVLAGQYEFFAVSYDLPTLFANKIVAFLERVYFRGKYQKIPFKGRDVYDLYWLFQLSGKSGFSLKPNVNRLVALTSNKDIGKIKELLKTKIMKVEEDYLYQDLYPLIESKQFLENFKDNFKKEICQKIDMIVCKG